MALTLTQGNMYSRTELDKIVTDLLVKDSRVLELLPFIELVGNSLTYDLVATRSGAGFYEVGDTWTESTVVLSQDTVTLKVMGGDADIDNFIARTRSNIIDVKTAVLEDKVKAVQELFNYCFIYGTTYDAKSFAGCHSLISSTTYNTVHAGSGTGTALSLDKLQQAIDLIRGFTPSIMLMSKAMRRGLGYYLDSVGDKFTPDRNELGKMIERYRNIEISANDFISDEETAADGAFVARTTGANTSIFILSFGEKAVCGVQGSNKIETADLGDLETKDARRYRIKWYPGLMFQNLRSSAKVDGIIVPSGATSKVTA